MYNSHIVIDNMGKLVAVYRKLHLYDVETPEFKFQESKVISGGTDLVSPLTDTPLEGGLGLLIVTSSKLIEGYIQFNFFKSLLPFSVMIYDSRRLVRFYVKTGPLI